MVKLSSTMIESVQARQRGAFQFEDHYDNLCALQDSVPLAAVKAHLDQGVIDLNGDRIRLNDWGPIINTIKINKSLQFIAVRSYYQVSNEEDEKRSAILRRKLPSIRSKEITHRLCKSLKECLFVSSTLSCIELQGLALRDRDLQVLVKGILRSQTLRHLSLESCRIGDQGLEILCKGLKNSKNINSVNLSGCSLSHRGAEALAGVVKHQGMQRHNEAWRDSLRYRRPDLDRMAGLRRITINNNPMMGDEGARMLAEALKDDLWLKALDLQGCGISTSGARSFLDVLKYNTTLVVLDLRRNPLVDRDVLHSLMEQLMLNSNGDDGEYKWMKSEDVESSPGLGSRGGKRRATKILNSNVGKKTTIKIVPGGVRRKPKVGVSTPTRLARQEIQPSPGLPWRTAARANRFRGHPPDGTKYSTKDSSDFSTSNSILVSSATNINNSRINDADDDDDDDDTLNVVIEKENASMKMNRIAAETADKIRRLEESHLAMNLDNKKEVMIELEQMRRQLREERLARARADQKVVALMLENRRLSVEVESLRRGQKVNGGLADDEKFLENIENSFKQFHAFIDMLKEAGLGQLVTMAGLDQNMMSIQASSSHNNNNSNVAFSSPSNNYHTFTITNQYQNGYSTGASHHHHSSMPTSSQLGGESPAYVNIAGVPTHSQKTAVSTATTAHHSQQQQQHRHASAFPISSMASYSEEAPIMIGDETNDSRHATAHLEDSKDVARKEADEVYSRLLHDTHGSLSHQGDSPHPINAGSRTAASGKFQSAVGVEEDDDVEEVIDGNDDDGENEWEEVSYENAASFSERGNESHQDKISRGDEEDGSDNDNF